MNLDQELEAVLKQGAEWHGSEDALWERVARRTAAAPRRRWWIGIVALGAVMAAAGFFVWWHQPPQELRISGGTEIIIPTMAGVVTDVKDGFVELSNVTGDIPPSGARIPVPAGRWITPTHWQADDQSLDLFKGQGISYALESRNIMPSMVFAKGVVLSVTGATVRMRVDEAEPEAGTEPLPPGEYSFRVAPYSHLVTRPFQPGDKITVGLFGEPGDLILWQVRYDN